uniref:Uncharacterized protein n=1 Tax=Triticum urartu TaxID=4572 RepID=A0A8R7QV31_TRIUA
MVAAPPGDLAAAFAFGGEAVAPPLDAEGAGAAARCSPWHLLKTEADWPQAVGRASTRVMLIGIGVVLASRAAQRHFTVAGVPTAVFTSVQQALGGRADLLPGIT